MIKLKNIILVHLCLLLFLAVSSVFVWHSNKSDFVVSYSQTLFFVLFFWVVMAQITLNGLLHLFTIFLGLFFLFLGGIPFLDLIGVIDIEELFLIVHNRLSNAIYIEVYTYMSFFLMFVFLGVLFGYKSEDYLKSKTEVNYSPFLFQTGVVLFFLAIPGILTKYFLQLQVILEKGYLAVFDGSLSQIDYPLITVGSGTLLLFGYCLFLSSKPTKKQFLIITAILLLTQFVNVLKGQRAVFLFPLIFSIWFYHKFYAKSLSKKKLIFSALCVVLFGQIFMVLRTTDEGHIRNLEQKSFMERYVGSFFVGQSVSFFILPYVLHYDLRNDRYPYLLAPLNIHYRSFQNMDRLQRSNTLSDQLTYRIDPNYFHRGVGVGSSIVAVFHDLRHIVAVLVSLIFGFLMARFEIFVKYSRVLLLFAFYFVSSIMMSPRFDMLLFFYDMVVLGVLFILVNAVYRFVQTQKIIPIGIKNGDN